MYQDYFSLKEMPFSISPDPRYMMLTPQHEEALAKCQYIINRRSGLAVIYGDVGTGKTTVARRIHDSFKDEENTKITTMITPDLKTDTAFLRAIMAEFGVAPKRSHAANISAFMRFAVEQYSQGTNLVLLVDEAQQMTPKMLEVVRVFLNFETDTEKCIQVILFGQNELAATLDLKEMRAIKSRVTLFGALSSMTSSDASKMIDYRWRAAGGDKHPFDPSAEQTIYRLSAGLPREIIKLCDQSLNRAVVNESKIVTSSMVEVAAKELRIKES